MKKLNLLLILIIAIQIASCKSNAKKEEEKPTVAEAKTEAKFSLKKAKNAINFTAYKTTEKIGVKGRFTKIDITNLGSGESIKEAINGAEFTIPISSIETDDSSRNFKIKKFFFGVMDKTSSLSGKLTLEDDKTGFVMFAMNGITEKLPFEYTIQDNTFTMNTSMDVTKWNAQEALASLNKACFDLHKGKDRVSKTWNDVTINIVSKF